MDILRGLFGRLLGKKPEQRSIEPSGSLKTIVGELTQLTHLSDMPRRIELCQEALSLVSREHDAFIWAGLQIELSHSLALNLFDNRETNIERAIEGYQQALEVLTRPVFPEQWARIMNNLGDAYRTRIRDDRAENIEQAITFYQQALEVRARKTMPVEWAETTDNLAKAYRNRIRGDRAENIEQAILYCRQALEVRTRKTMPVEWAITVVNLANAYYFRRRGDRSENIEQAITHYKQAQEVKTRETMPVEWAEIMNNLAEIYRNRIRGDQAENIELAIAYCQQALQVMTRKDMAVRWSTTMINRALLYYSRILGSSEENVELAIQSCEEALTVLNRDNYREWWARAQSAMGDAYLSRTRGDPIENQAHAIHAYENALAVYLPDRFPNEALNTSRNLSSVLFERKEWNRAHSAMIIAIQAAQYLYTAALTEEEKSREIGENTRLYRHVVDVCLHIEPPRLREAFLYAEEDHSRLLREQLGTLPLSPPSHVPADLIEHESRLLDIVRNSENAIRSAPDDATRWWWVNERIVTQAKLGDLWEQLSRDYNATDYVALRRGDKLKWDDVQRWLVEQERRITFLEFFTLDGRLVAFIVKAGEAEPRIITLKIDPEQLFDRYVELFYREVVRFDPKYPPTERWRELSVPLLCDVMSHLSDTELLYLIPHGALHYLPLHALEYNGRPLIEYFPIAYAPSVAVAIRMSSHPQRTRKSRSGGTLVVGNPTEDLPFAEKEAEAVAQLFEVPPLLGAKATKTQVLADLSDKAMVHIAAHAHYDSRDPFASGIVLSSNEILTAREVLSHSLEAELVVLSGCETGRQHIRDGDELVGLARAFLYTGVSTLILSLWKVRDDTTKDVFIRFYNHLYSRDGAVQSSAGALQAAMLETCKKLPSTYYWAPFILYGDWR